MGRGRSNEWEDEPLTPAGRLFAQPEMRQIIHCVVGTKNPFDIDSVKSELRKSAMLQHPRFTSLLVRDRRGREHWRPTQVDIERHVLIIDRPLSDADHDSAVNSYLADLSTEGLSMEKPLWELHILMAHNCAIFRIHHSLGDGISLMSMLLACCRKLHDPHSVPTIASSSSSSSSRSRNTTWPNILWNLAVTLWFCLVFDIFHFYQNSSMASVIMSFAPATGRVFAATAAKGASGGNKEEKGLLDWILGNLQKEDQLLETDPILKKVEDKSGGGTTNGGRRNSVAVPQKKKNGGFGGLFAKN